MAISKRVYWDACTWIALIQQERIRDQKGNVTEDRYAMARNVITGAEKNNIEIATSTLSLAEVCKSPGVQAQADKLGSFFDVDYILLVNLDRAVGEMARSLMMRGFSKLKPPDACHVAAAAIANVEEMHTFDDKLLALDGKIQKQDGTALKICKPDMGSAAPLLKAMQKPLELDLETPGPVKAPMPSPSPELDLELEQVPEVAVSLPDPVVRLIDLPEQEDLANEPKATPLQIEGPKTAGK